MSETISNRPWSVNEDKHSGHIVILDAAGDTIIIDDLGEAKRVDFEHLVACVNANYFTQLAQRQNNGG